MSKRSPAQVKAERAINTLINAVVKDKQRIYYGTSDNVGAYVDPDVEAARQMVLGMILNRHGDPTEAEPPLDASTGNGGRMGG